MRTTTTTITCDRCKRELPEGAELFGVSVAAMRVRPGEFDLCAECIGDFGQFMRNELVDWRNIHDKAGVRT